MSEPGSQPLVLNNYISVKTAAIHSGYNMQYLRRLLRDGRLTGMKLGQTWLIDKRIFEAYLDDVSHTKDKRYGPKNRNPIIARAFQFGIKRHSLQRS